MIKYTINKGINKPLEFKGLKAQYIGYLAIGLLLSLMGFAVVYVLGVSRLGCLSVAAVLITGVFWTVFRLNATYGEHGLMKKLAQKQMPSSLVIRSRKIFLKLATD